MAAVKDCSQFKAMVCWVQVELATKVLLLVCCHGARDARCGTAGPALAAELARQVRLRGLADRIDVFSTSHVGGHKYAGNVLVYGASHPADGDWFGSLHAENAAEFVDAVVGMVVGVDGGAEDPRLRRWWRGRMGLSKQEQLDLYAAGGALEDAVDCDSSDDVEGEGYSSSDDDEGEEEYSGSDEEGAPGRTAAAAAIEGAGALNTAAV